MKIKLLGLFLFFVSALPAQTAFEIIKKAEDQLRGQSSSGQLAMTIVRPSWERTIEMKSWSEGTDYSMILITAPARDKGTVFLKKDKEIYNWVPSIERTVKLPPSMMMQSWMGSDFTNDDLVQESSLVTDYHHEITNEENIRGVEVWEITLTPKPEAPVVWGKIVIHVSKEGYQQLRSEFYDEDGELVNVMEGFDIKDIGGRKLPSRMVMTPVNEEGHKTILQYHALDFSPDIPEGFFTTQNMKRLR